MKKICFLAILSFTGVINAQNTDNYGIKAGLNFSNLNSANSVDLQTKVGFYFGGFIEKKHSDKGSFIGEAIFTFQGAKIRNNAYSYPSTYPNLGYNTYASVADVDIAQLNIPIYYDYKINSNFSIYGGGYLGIILDSKISGINFSNNTIDLGLLAGSSFKISRNLSANAQYNLGLLRLDDLYQFRNRVFQIGLSYNLK